MITVTYWHTSHTVLSFIVKPVHVELFMVHDLIAEVLRWSAIGQTNDRQNKWYTRLHPRRVPDLICQLGSFLTSLSLCCHFSSQRTTSASCSSRRYGRWWHRPRPHRDENIRPPIEMNGWLKNAPKNTELPHVCTDTIIITITVVVTVIKTCIIHNKQIFTLHPAGIHELKR